MSELPGWADEMRDLFRSGSAAQFLIHGNVFDVVPAGGRLLSVPAFLDEVMFAQYDVVLRYDRSRGVRATRGSEDWGDWVKSALGTEGNALTLMREPGSALELIDRYLLRTLNLQAVRADKPKRIAVIIEFAEFVVPRGDAFQLGGGFAANAVKVLGWANDPAIAQSNIVTVLMSEGLHDLNRLVVDNPHTAALHIPLPDEKDMQAYVQALAASQFPDLEAKSEVPIATLGARLTGLSRVGARTAISLAIRNGQPITAAWLGKIKKDLIERECQDLLEFVESPFTLDNVAGHEAVKEWLRQDTVLLRRGAATSAPDGLSHCRPHWHRQDVHRPVLGGRDRASRAWCSRTSATAGSAPPSRTSRRSSRCCAPSAKSWFSSTRPIRRPAGAEGATATAACRGASTRCSPRKCRTRATAAASSGCLRRRGPTCSKWI